MKILSLLIIAATCSVFAGTRQLMVDQENEKVVHIAAVNWNICRECGRGLLCSRLADGRLIASRMRADNARHLAGV